MNFNKIVITIFQYYSLKIKKKILISNNSVTYYWYVNRFVTRREI